jgi:cell division septation protein DedD
MIKMLQKRQLKKIQLKKKKEPVKEVATEPKKVVAPVTETKVEPKPAAKLPTPTATKTSQPIAKPKTVAASADGKHLVIVGNFLQAVNAQQRLEELKKAGFNNVEIVNFDLSEYHTVCAGRFDDVNEARRLVKKLKDYHKIDAYVRIGS